MEPHTPLRPAKNVHVPTSNSVVLDVDLGFGVHLNRRATLDGVQQKDIPYAQRKEARHCLVVLLAKKKLLVRFADEDAAKPTIARIYLAERVHGTPPGLTDLPGLDHPVLEISAFFLSLRDSGFDVERVKTVLNGPKR